MLEKRCHEVSLRSATRTHAHTHTNVQVSKWLSTTTLLPQGVHICRHTDGSHSAADTHTGAGARRGEQTEAHLHTQGALSGLGVASCGPSRTAKPSDSQGGSEGHILTGWPGKHCFSSRMFFLSTCLELPYLTHQPPLSLRSSPGGLSSKPKGNC